jgi:hypothetical protein
VKPYGISGCVQKGRVYISHQTRQLLITFKLVHYKLIMDHIDMNRLKSGEINLGVCKYVIVVISVLIASKKKDLNHGRSV